MFTLEVIKTLFNKSMYVLPAINGARSDRNVMLLRKKFTNILQDIDFHVNKDSISNFVHSYSTYWATYIHLFNHMDTAR